MILSIATDGFTEESEIFLIGVRGVSTTKIWKRWEFESESAMIENFITYFTGIDDKIVIGFNILKFDLLKLMMKARNTRSFETFFKKINLSNVVDLFVILTFLHEGVIKGLSVYGQQYGIHNNIPTDRNFMSLYKEKKHDQLVAQFSDKLEAINNLFHVLWEKIKKDGGEHGTHLL